MRFLILLLAVTACDTTTRCADVSLAQIQSDVHAQAEERFLQTLHDLDGYSSMNDSVERFHRRALRAQWAAELKQFSDSSAEGDTVRLRMIAEGHTPALDSAEPEPRLPPRPSDLRWYAEHCYEGKAR